MLGLERLRQRFTPKPEEAPGTGKPGMLSPQDMGKTSAAGEFKARVPSPAESAPLEPDAKVIVEKQKPDLRIVPFDETADWIQQTAAQPETKQAGKQVFAKAEARAREKQLEQLVGAPEELAQKTRAQKQELAERDKTHAMVREHQAAPPPEQTLDKLVTQMTQLNIRRAELEVGVENANKVLDDVVVALGRVGALKDTVQAMKKATQARADAKKQVAKVDEEIRAIETQMSEVIDYMRPERAQELKTTAAHTAEILKGTEMDPRDRTRIEQWFVDPQKEFDKDVYEALRPNASPEDLAALKTNSLSETKQRETEKRIENNLGKRDRLELERKQLDLEFNEKFERVVGCDVVDLRSKKSAWGRLLIKARLGELRSKFADWEHRYNELRNKIEQAGEEVEDDELYLINPHKAGVNDAERIIKRLFSRQARASEPREPSRWKGM